MPELLDQVTIALGKPVFIVEGEKDADRLWELFGLPATTCALGADKWLPEYSDFLSDRDCVILPDNDEQGKRHTDKIAKSLYKGEGSFWIGEVIQLALIFSPVIVVICKS